MRRASRDASFRSPRDRATSQHATMERRGSITRSKSETRPTNDEVGRGRSTSISYGIAKTRDRDRTRARRGSVESQGFPAEFASFAECTRGMPAARCALDGIEIFARRAFALALLIVTTACVIDSDGNHGLFRRSARHRDRRRLLVGASVAERFESLAATRSRVAT